MFSSFFSDSFRPRRRLIHFDPRITQINLDIRRTAINLVRQHVDDITRDLIANSHRVRRQEAPLFQPNFSYVLSPFPQISKPPAASHPLDRVPIQAATTTREGTQSRSEGDTCENIRQPHQQTTKTPSAISHFSAPLPASTSVPATAALAQETVDRSPVPRTSRQSQTPPLTFPIPIQPERSTEPTIQRNGPLLPTPREGGQTVPSRVHEDVQELSSLTSMDRLSNWPIMDVVPEQSLLMKPQVVEVPPGLQQSSLLREPKLKKLRMTSEQKDVMTITGSILLALDLDPRCRSYASSVRTGFLSDRDVPHNANTYYTERSQPVKGAIA